MRVVSLWLILLGLMHGEIRDVTQLFSVPTTKAKALKQATFYESYGFTVPNEALKVRIAPRYLGYVTKLFTPYTYARIKKGDAIAEVYAPDVYRAKEEYVRAYRYSGDKKTLFALRRKLDLLGVASQEIEVLKKEALTPKYTTIYATHSGIVMQKRLYLGDAFKAGNTLLEIVDDRIIWVEVEIPESDLSRINGTQKIDVVLSSGEVIRGKIILIEPEIKRTSGKGVVRIEVENPKAKLRFGMYAKVRFYGAKQERLLLEKSAVILKNERAYAFIKGEYEGEWEPVLLTIRPFDAGHYEVLSGLKAGEEVAKEALFMRDSDAINNGLY